MSILNIRVIKNDDNTKGIQNLKTLIKSFLNFNENLKIENDLKPLYNK